MIATPRCSFTAGQTSAQYFVHATSRSSRPNRSSVEVMEGCRETTRSGVKSPSWEKIATMLELIVTMHSPQLLDHFQNPRNAGSMESPDISVLQEDPAGGDVMKLMLRLKDGRIAEVRYQVRGCVAAIACGSVLEESLAGTSLSEASEIRRQSLIDALGGLPNESMHASHLAMDCLKLALKQLGK